MAAWLAPRRAFVLRRGLGDSQRKRGRRWRGHARESLTRFLPPPPTAAPPAAAPTQLLVSPENITHIKIADFGLAKQTAADAMTSVCGTPVRAALRAWRAPPPAACPLLGCFLWHSALVACRRLAVAPVCFQNPPSTEQSPQNSSFPPTIVTRARAALRRAGDHQRQPQGGIRPRRGPLVRRRHPLHAAGRLPALLLGERGARAPPAAAAVNPSSFRPSGSTPLSLQPSNPLKIRLPPFPTP